MSPCVVFLFCKKCDTLLTSNHTPRWGLRFADKYIKKHFKIFRGYYIMSEKLFLIVAGILDSFLAIASAFVSLPMVVMLVVAVVPCLLTIPFFKKAA